MSAMGPTSAMLFPPTVTTTGVDISATVRVATSTSRGTTTNVNVSSFAVQFRKLGSLNNLYLVSALLT